MASHKSDTVFITISPPTSLMKLSYRHQYYYDLLDPVLRRMCKSYILYPEFDNKGRLHYHGFLHDFDEIKYIATNYKLNRIGWTKVDKLKTFKDQLRTVLYCQKEWRKTTKIFECADIKIKPLFKKSRKTQHSAGPPSPPSILDFFAIKH